MHNEYKMKETSYMHKPNNGKREQLMQSVTFNNIPLIKYKAKLTTQE